MKTIRIVNLGGPDMAAFYNLVRSAAPTLPQHVQDERIYQHALAYSVVGTVEDPGYGFYETSEDDLQRGLLPTDPIGAIEVRIDFDPSAPEFSEPGNLGEAIVAFEQAMDIIWKPYAPFTFADRASFIGHVRVKVKIADDRTVEHTYWPVTPYSQEDIDAMPRA